MTNNKLFLFLSAALFSGISTAYEAGDIIIKAGAITVAPHESSDQVIIQGPNTRLGEVKVDNDTQLGLTGTYMVSQHIGLELLAATPFEHNIKGSTGTIKGLNIGSTKHLPPSLIGLYYPMDAQSVFQPYAGIGINYTTFFDANTSSALNSALSVPSSSMDLQDSWGWTAEIGADYALNDKWLLTASLRYIDIDTKADINASGTHLKVDVEIDPWVPMVGVGYKF